MTLARAAVVLIFSLTLLATARAEQQERVSQYGITWVFDKPATVGKYVTGDWWVVGPVNIHRVLPPSIPGKNGSVVNPKAGKTQGYDERIDGYDPALAAKYPLTLNPGESLVSTASVENIGDKTAETVEGQGARGPLRTAVVLTCVAAPPPADAFRPAYCGTEKLQFTVSQLKRDRLPKLASQGKVPDVAKLERAFQRIWLDHLFEWPGRMMHPLENMPDYGREITNTTGTAALVLLLDDPAKKNEKLLIRYVQLGIDLYGITQSDNDLWRANGGHHSGRKLPILFAGILLDHQGMMNVKASFAEDEQTYYGKGYRGQTVLWKISREPERQHEEIPPEKWSDPPFKGDNNGKKSEAYRRLNGPTWVATALTARILGAKSLWNHDAFFDYVDRWFKEESGPDGKIENVGGEFVYPMWQKYRAQADELGAAAIAKRGPTTVPTATAPTTAPAK